MKISRDSPIQSVRPSKVRAGSTVPAEGGTFAALIGDGGTTGTTDVSAAPAVAPVDSLLAAQEVPDGTKARRRDWRRGATILDSLDDIRIGLLTGMIPGAKLNQLIRNLGIERATTADPKLAAVLDEIDLRAQVELAKLSVRG